MSLSCRWLFVGFAWLIEVMSCPACPVCDSEIGCQVRAGIFNDDFGRKLFLTLLPFPFFIGVVAAIHYGFPFRQTSKERRRSHGTSDPEARS